MTELTYNYDARDNNYTGKERDAESGNDYFGARYYASTMGRWMSPDLPFADQDPVNPQSWNLFVYVRNNPLNERHLRRIVREWASHYNRGRPHSRLGPGIPNQRTATPQRVHRHRMSVVS
jgi:RHS repeat-associated protein